MSMPDSRDAALAFHPLLAARLLRLKQSVAEQVTEEFLQRHPDWLERYGERARLRGVEDAAYHIDFLAGALESRSVASFERYARWTSGVLLARGIDPRFVAENFAQLEAALRAQLTEAEGALIATLLRAGRAQCGAAPAAAPEQPTGAGLTLSQQVFVQTLLAGQRRAALQVVLEAMRSGASLTDIYVEIIQESLYEIGRLWESNRISVATEHMATAIVQTVVAQLYAQVTPPAPTRGKIVLTGIRGELHHVGANLVADVLEADGWDVRYLSSNLPHGDILAAIDEHQADILGLSATMLFSLPQVREVIAAVRGRFGPHRPRIVLGGGIFRQDPTLAATLGADGSGTDVRAVSALMQAVLDSRPPA